MKKIFTLIAATLLSSGAFAQQEWQNLVVNGDMEGEQDPTWSCFWVHEFRPESEIPAYDESTGQQVVNGQFQGFANIVEDPKNPGNHCAKLVARSEAEADEAGNKITPDGSSDLASWDSQFFVYVKESIPEGKELRLTMRVLADKATYGETQAHNAPGDYNHYQLFGNADFTTEWKKIQLTTTITADMTQSANGKEMHTVAFNLSVEKTGNVYYFDDVKLEMRDPKGPGEFQGWFNLLRHGTVSEDKIAGTNFTNFTGRDGVDGRDVKARVITDADGEPALNVTSIGWTGTLVNPILDEENNPVLDEEGNPTFEEKNYYSVEPGDTLWSIDDWQTQFFVTVPHKFTTGQPYKLVMWARADKDAQIDTQAHTTPGGYKHWQMVGSLNLTTEWQQFVLDGEADTNYTISSDQNTCQTIAFNCNKLKEDNNYYFRFQEFSFNAGDVTMDERILGTEDITLPIPDPDAENGIQTTVDFSKCVSTLELTNDDFDNMLHDNHIMLPLNDEEYTAAMQASTGVMLGENGLFDEDGAYILEIGDEGSTIEQTIINIYNMGDESFAGKEAYSKFCFTFNDWNYLFNVKLVDAKSYLGINDVNADTRNGNGAIYDLMGRKVEKATKGLYIINGKKYLVK